MKGTNAPCFVCREHDSLHISSSTTWFKYRIIADYRGILMRFDMGGTWRIGLYVHLWPPRFVARYVHLPRWANDEGDFEWRLGRDHVLQSPERQVADQDTAHLLCWHEPQNHQFYLDYGACSIWNLAMIQKKKSKKVREGKRGRSEETCFHLDLPTRSLRKISPRRSSHRKNAQPRKWLEERACSNGLPSSCGKVARSKPFVWDLGDLHGFANMGVVVVEW